MVRNHVEEGLILSTNNASELADTNKEVQLKDNTKLKVERDDDGGTHISLHFYIHTHIHLYIETEIHRV